MTKSTKTLAALVFIAAMFVSACSPPASSSPDGGTNGGGAPDTGVDVPRPGEPGQKPPGGNVGESGGPGVPPTIPVDKPSTGGGGIPAGSLGIGAASAAKTPLPQGDVLYVATNGSDSNPGTVAAPFRTMAKALAAVRSGGNVVVRGGTYHESFKTLRTTKIQNYPGERVVFDGTTALSGFAPSGNSWVLTGWT
ncbi:MAG TPA: DUF1565 domain-containing protein, partial [Microthrixaceae bacterium]|nr:DUF1565 domain-containing protein [Microthrixaceae bacterium]